MSYQVLARKWRPRKFAELVGQEHVVRALTNGPNDTNPTWSPDGSVIVFERGNGASTDLYVIASTGSPGSEKLLVANGIQPTVSIDTN